MSNSPTQEQHLGHNPVLLNEMLEAIAPKDGEVYIDGTFGGGGYTKAILQAADCTVLGIDQDPDAAKRAEQPPFKDNPKFHFLAGRFSQMGALAYSIKQTKIHGIVLDIGVSSFQIDQAERGFSFSKPGPLDMRMNPEQGPSAADFVNTASEEDIIHVLRTYGEEKLARRIAKRILEKREIAPLTTTQELVDITVASYPKGYHKISPATRTFQALRIHVNRELEELETALRIAENILQPGGRLVVVTFHSLEDRIVKNFFKKHSTKQSRPSRFSPAVVQEEGEFEGGSLRIITSKAIKASKDETDQNPRARSAKLRTAIKVAAKNQDGGAQ